jgi:hypothetical protein
VAVKCLDFGKNFSVVSAVNQNLAVGLYSLGEQG